MFKGKNYYGEFSQSPEKISTNILANRLDKLEAESIISKTRDIDNRSKFKYELTQKGKDLLPVLLDIIQWSAKYDALTATTKSFVKRIKSDRIQLTREILEAIK